MLINCPECELQVSDKAVSCPHCGYPLKPDKISRPSTKRMRLPNGFGQITEIKHRNLRNRFRVMITEGFTEEGQPIQKMLKPRAYFPTYKDAYEALIEYHKNPYNPNQELTVEEVYNKWIEKHSEEVSTVESLKQYKSAWLYCNSIKKMKIRDVRAHHIKDCINYGIKISEDDEIVASPQKKSSIKILFNLLFDYAIEYEYADKNYARSFKLPKNIKEGIDESLEHHMTFTEEEMETLWSNWQLSEAQLILVQCYMGWRPQELCELKISNVHLDEHYIIGGMKTVDGRDRVVPIHPKIEPIISDCLKRAKANNSEYLFLIPDKRTSGKMIRLTYNKYYKDFRNIIDQLELNPDHKPHDPRKQFITAAKEAQMNEYAIKLIVGHKITDITEAIYTERKFDWLYDEICKIK